MDGLLDFLFRAVTFLGVLFVLVFVHELGHFATAKWAGVRVLEFGIGFPPRAWAFRRGETEYSLNWLPLGGFVRMVGEEDPSDPRSLAAASIPWRLVILSAGVIMNLVLAFVLLTVSGMLPKQELRGEMFIANVREGSPAQLAGIQPNDVVVAVNGRPIRNFQDLNYNVRLNLGTPTTITVRRNGQTLEKTVTPRIAPPPGEGATGVEIGSNNPIWRYRLERGLTVQQLADQVGVPVEVARVWDSSGPQAVGRLQSEQPILQQRGQTVEQYAQEMLQQLAQALGVSQTQLTESYFTRETVALSPLDAIPAGVQRSGEILVLFRNDILSMVMSRAAPQVAGPVGIFEITGRAAQQASQNGVSVLLDLTALLSLNLAIVNALPIPMLDGGRILFVLIEAIRGGRRISPEKERYAHLVGAALLLTLIVVVTFNDVTRLISGESFFR